MIKMVSPRRRTEMRSATGVVLILVTVVWAQAGFGAAWDCEPSLKQMFDGRKIVFPYDDNAGACVGHARKEFVLPEGRIWKAVANVGAANDQMWHGNRIVSALYLNGRFVQRPFVGSASYGAQPVNLKPYLRPGRNCAASSGYRKSEHSPTFTCQPP